MQEVPDFIGLNTENLAWSYQFGTLHQTSIK